MKGQITFQELSEELYNYLVNLGVASGNPKFAGYKIQSKDIVITATENNQRVFIFNEDEDIINSSIKIVTLNTTFLSEDKYTISNNTLTLLDDGIEIGDNIRVLFVYLNIVIGEANPGSISEEFLSPELLNKINNKSDIWHTHKIATYEDTMIGVNDTDIITPAKLSSYAVNVIGYKNILPYKLLSSYTNYINTVDYSLLIDDNIYLYSGNIVYKYNVLSNEFTKLSDFPINITNKRGIYINNYIYFLSADNDIKAHYKYDIENDIYTDINIIPHSFTNGSLINYNKIIYMIGGLTESNKIYKYDTLNDTYTHVYDMPVNIYINNSIILDNIIYIVSKSHDNIPGYICKYDIENNIFENLIELTTFNDNSYSYVLYNDNGIYIISNETSYVYNIDKNDLLEITSPNIIDSHDINILYDSNNTFICDNNSIYSYSAPIINKSHNHSIEYIYNLRNELNDINRRIDDADHEHEIDDIFGLNDALDNKSDKNHKHIKAEEIDAIEGSDNEMYMTPYTVKVAFNNALDNINDTNSVMNKKITNEFISFLPIELSNGFSLSYDNEIHILCDNDDSGKMHYKFNGNKWISASILPFNKINAATVHNNEIHIIKAESSAAEKNHYRWNGSRWTIVSTTPYKTSNQTLISFNNELHLFGGDDNYLTHYKFINNEWVKDKDLPYEFLKGCAVVINNELHIISSKIDSYKAYHYKYSNGNWTNVSELPLYNNWTNAIVFDNEIYIFGNDDNLIADDIDASRFIYKFSTENNNWSFVNYAPYTPIGSSFVNHNNKVYILGGMENYSKLHYSVLPINKYIYYLPSKTKILLNKKSHKIITNLKEISNGYEVIMNGIVEFYNNDLNNDIHTII